MENKVYTFDEKKHKHYLNGEVLNGVTTVLGIIDKPQLVQWAADVSAATALTVSEVYPDLLYFYEKAQALSDPDEKKKAKAELDKDFPIYKKARTAHRQKKEKAADWGKIVHKAIEEWIGGRPDNAPPPQEVEIMGEICKILPEHQAAIDNFIRWAVDNDVRFFESEKGIYSEEWQVGGIVDFVCQIKGKMYVGDLKTSSDIYETYWLQTAAYAKMMVEMGLEKRFHGMIIINCKKDGTFNSKERFHIDDNTECFKAALTLYKRFND